MNRTLLFWTVAACFAATSSTVAAAEHFAEPRPRQTPHGWEVRGEHFTVLATTRAEDAMTANDHLERAWRAAADLSRPWIPGDRKKQRRTIAVGVLIDDHPRRVAKIAAPSEAFQQQTSGIFVSVARGRPPLARQLSKLRQDAVLAYYRREGVDADLPRWVQTGLARYVARRTGERSAAADEAANAASRGVQPPAASDESAERWVRFFMEGDDARHLPAFFAALATSIEADPTADGKFAFHWTRPQDRPGEALSLDRLTDDHHIRRDVARWLKDPLTGRPVLDVPVLSERKLAPRRAEMALVLKLARRFAPRGVEAAAAKVARFPKGAAAQPATRPAAPPRDTSALYEHLTRYGDALAWATIDVSGEVLLSTNLRRLDEVFRDPLCQYRFVRRDGRVVLECREGAGVVLHAWLEANPDDPHRPLVRFASPPAVESPVK